MGFLDEKGLAQLWGKIKSALSGKQDSLTEGRGISIEGSTISVKLPTVYLSQDEYDSLTAEQKNEDVIYATPGNGGSGGGAGEEVYSTEETRIGTWIDGKPLYREVHTGLTVQPLGTLIMDLGDRDLKFVRGFLTSNSGGLIQIPSYQLNGSWVNVYRNGATNTLRWSTNDSDADFIGAQAVLVLEYTKTTS